MYLVTVIRTNDEVEEYVSTGVTVDHNCMLIVDAENNVIGIPLHGVRKFESVEIHQQVDTPGEGVLD